MGNCMAVMGDYISQSDNHIAMHAAVAFIIFTSSMRRAAFASLIYTARKSPTRADYEDVDGVVYVQHSGRGDAGWIRFVWLEVFLAVRSTEYGVLNPGLLVPSALFFATPQHLKC